MYHHPMRLLLSSLLLVSLPLFAQDGKKGGPPAPPKNLKLLDANQPRAQLIATMRSFEAALGVSQCTFCHVQGDFASDDNPKKNTARMMITMARQINANFTDGKQHVRCYTCHRGMEIPAMEPPAGAGDDKK
jgi:hypothetical protein